MSFFNRTGKKLDDFDGEIIAPRHSRLSKRRRFQQVDQNKRKPLELSSDAELNDNCTSTMTINHSESFNSNWEKGSKTTPVLQSKPNLVKQRSSSGPDGSKLAEDIESVRRNTRSRSGPESSFDRQDNAKGPLDSKVHYLTTSSDVKQAKEGRDSKSSYGENSLNSQTELSPIHDTRLRYCSALQLQSTKTLTAVLAAASVAGAESIRDQVSDEEDNKNLARYLKLRNTRSSVDEHGLSFMSIISNQKKRVLKRSRTSLRRRINKEPIQDPIIQLGTLSNSNNDLNFKGKEKESDKRRNHSSNWRSHCQITRRTSIVPSRWTRNQSDNKSSSENENDSEQQFFTSPEWLDSAKVGEHYWSSIQSSGYNCFLDDSECTSGPKRKCSACHIVVHDGCVPRLNSINFICKPTFREDMKNDRNNILVNVVRHHWVHKKKQDGKCKQCGKSFQLKLPFNKEVLAITCSWCKDTYHNRMQCFMIHLMTEPCSLGSLASVIVPPTWILRKNVRPSSKVEFNHTKSIEEANSRTFSRSQSRKLKRRRQIPFEIKPIASGVNRALNNPSNQHPLLVLINCRSGGNQGSKLLQKFQWLLNPRQVFDISQSGPKLALELFKDVPNLRILVCGGDGTVGWILKTIELIGIKPFPPCAILPLGTGNDLARTLNWGSGYVDESVKKIIQYVDEGSIVQLDRWNVSVEANLNCVGNTEDEDCCPVENKAGSETEDQTGQVNTSDSNVNLDNPETVSINFEDDEMMVNVFNNYFSLGADAAAALEFHESREANPEKFNSRLRNKMFYFGVGGKDLLKRSWRDLTDHITLHCDRLDLTPRIRSLKLHCLLFLNIPKYSAGTIPWGNPTYNMGFEPQRIDDGYLEVIGFTSTSLATLQVGGHGFRICQCRTAVLTTTKAVPMQVDGEPCRLKPSIIKIWRRSQAALIRKTKRKSSINMSFDDGNYTAPLLPRESSISERIRMEISVISYLDYEEVGFDRELVQQTSIPLSMVSVENDATLDVLREYITLSAQKTPILFNGEKFYLSANWLFLDTTTNERLFRIEKSQESFYYITDLNSEQVFILDEEWANFSDSSNHSKRGTSLEEESLHSYDSIRRRDTLVNPPSSDALKEIIEKTEATNENLESITEDQTDVKNAQELGSLFVDTEEVEKQNKISELLETKRMNSKRLYSVQYPRNSSKATVNTQFEKLDDQSPEMRDRSNSENPSLFKSISKAPTGLRNRRQSLYPLGLNQMRKSGRTSVIAQNQLNSIFNSPAVMAVVESATKAAVSATLKSFAMQNEEALLFGPSLNDEEDVEYEDEVVDLDQDRNSDLNFKGPDETEIDEAPISRQGSMKNSSDDKSDKQTPERNSINKRRSSHTPKSEYPRKSFGCCELSRRNTLIHGPKICVTPEEAAVSAVNNVIRKCSIIGLTNPNQLGYDARLQKRRDSFIQALNRALHEACKRGQTERVKDLINDGADPLSLDSNTGMTCFHQAARFGRDEIVRYLIQVEPELINFRDAEKGQTALHKAAWCQRKRVCFILLLSGASNALVDNEKRRPDEEALRAGDAELSKFIREFRIDEIINLSSEDRTTSDNKT